MFWNEDTFDIESSCEFVREAYQMKKYAFVSDYVRLWALKKYGGIYLDTDIELIKPIPKSLLDNKVVLGTDDGGRLTALMMSEPEHIFFSEALENYHNMSFVLENGKLNMEVNNTALQNLLVKYGYVVSNSKQHLDCGILLLPDDYFHIRSLTTGKLNLTENSVAIHWHTITWVSLKTRFINKLRINVIVPIIGHDLYVKITRKIKNGRTTF